MTTRQKIIDDILAVGLVADQRGDFYGPRYAPHARPSGGMWQHPEELADFLLFVTKRPITSFLNIGTFNARTFNFVGEYLNQFREVRCVTVDPLDHDYERRRGFEYLKATSADFAWQLFDLVFIDGHHAYGEARKDWENVGRHARICAFHDIDDDYIRGDATLDGGVCRLWDELKADRDFVEFIAPEKPRRAMGIGVLT